MFSVFGRSKILARKEIDKAVATGDFHRFVGLESSLDSCSSQTEKFAVLDKFTQKIFEQMKPKKCTLEFSTPEIASEAYSLMKSDPSNFGDLQRMKKADLGHKSKTTGKPILKWVPIDEKVA